MVVFSLSVPPADLPRCGGMFALATAGLILSWRGTRAWRVTWTIALGVASLAGALEIVAGSRIHHQLRDAQRLKAAPP
jgi:hypothetical protein